MSPRRLAVLAWVVPMVALALVGVGVMLDKNVPWPEAPLEDLAPCYGTEDGETVGPQGPPLRLPTTLRRFASVATSETVTGALLVPAGVGALGCAVAVILRTRRTRREHADARAAFRIAVLAMIFWLSLPTIVAVGMLIVVMSFPIRG